MYKLPSDSIISKEAKLVIQKCLEVDYRKRATAKNLIKDNDWVRCKDLPLSIFENAGSIFRASSMDKKIKMSLHGNRQESSSVMIESSEGVVNAEVFNNSLVNIHGTAIDYLKMLGYN
jgi:serine/threonine protein kinase